MNHLWKSSLFRLGKIFSIQCHFLSRLVEDHWEKRRKSSIVKWNFFSSQAQLIMKIIERNRSEVKERKQFFTCFSFFFVVVWHCFASSSCHASCPKCKSGSTLHWTSTSLHSFQKNGSTRKRILLGLDAIESLFSFVYFVDRSNEWRTFLHKIHPWSEDMRARCKNVFIQVNERCALRASQIKVKPETRLSEQMKFFQYSSLPFAGGFGYINGSKHLSEFFDLRLAVHHRYLALNKNVEQCSR